LAIELFGSLFSFILIFAILVYNKSMKELLNIVDNDDKIIGEKTREEIHREGLLHREVHVYFITPNKELILQHRAKDKDTYPDLLDATVGGHVEMNDNYEQTAIKEAEEETGVEISPDNLIFLSKTKRWSEDKATGKINNAIGQSYIYIFTGELSDLKIEAGKSLGFEIWSSEKLLNISEVDSKKFIPYILEFSKTELASFMNNFNNSIYE